jgi:transposase, IS5 family
MMSSTLIAGGIEAIMFRAYGPGPSLWESVLPEIALRMPAELARVDELLDDPALGAVPAVLRRRAGKALDSDGVLPEVDVLGTPGSGAGAQ